MKEEILDIIETILIILPAIIFVAFVFWFSRQEEMNDDNYIIEHNKLGGIYSIEREN